MKINTESVSLLDQADKLAGKIIQSVLFQRYVSSKRTVFQDGQAQRLISNFDRVKGRYEEVQRFGHAHPDYHQAIRQMMEAKRAMDLNPLIAGYKKAERDLQKLLQEVSLLLARSVSQSVMVPANDPFFARSGKCGKDASCQCRVN